jgi:hypothetical protein
VDERELARLRDDRAVVARIAARGCAIDDHRADRELAVERLASRLEVDRLGEALQVARQRRVGHRLDQSGERGGVGGMRLRKRLGDFLGVEPRRVFGGGFDGGGRRRDFGRRFGRGAGSLRAQQGNTSHGSRGNRPGAFQSRHNGYCSRR